MASVSVDKTVRIWDINSGKVLSMLFGHSDTVLCVQFSGDDGIIATGGQDKRVIIWDGIEGTMLHVINGHDFYVHSVVFSPDINFLMTGSMDETAKLWEIPEKLKRNKQSVIDSQ